MQYLIEKILLFLLSFVPLFSNFNINQCTIACLMILTLSSLAYYSDSGKYSAAIALFTIILVWFHPALGLFLPMTAYDCIDPKLSKQEKIISFLGIAVALFFLYTKIPTVSYLFVLLFIAVAVYLGNQFHSIQHLQETIRKNRDTDYELQLLLEQKNADLIQKSNFEIEMATLQERNRIAREIHDNVGHLLTRSILQVGALNTINNREEFTPYYEQLQNTLNQAMDTIRASVHNLYQQDINLRNAIENFIRNISELKIDLEYQVEQISQTITCQFLAIIKEGINNTIRHSNADTLKITLLEHPQFYRLTIEDNGTSIPRHFQFPSPSHNGMGLSSMQERVLSMHGTMEIFTKKGFKIFVIVPKNKTKDR